MTSLRNGAPMIRKIVFLFVALLLPVLIFLFLKKFGRNEFEIPLLYATSADSLNTVCGTRYTSPYAISDSSLTKLGWKGKKATIVVFDGTPRKELDRIPDTFSAEDFDLIVARDKAKTASQYERLISCVFFVTQPKNVVLVDQQKRIRGYYTSDSRDETDRLIVELKILLKHY